MEKAADTTTISPETKDMLPQIFQVSLWLDNYDDIFSDFDPRHYSQRALSDDFLLEAKKATRETATGRIELKFLIPENQRKLELEGVIKKRLRAHFKKHYFQQQEQRNEIIRQGAAYIALGFILMFLTTTILFWNLNTNFILTLISVIAEPAGWFLLWEGLNLVIFRSKEKNPDLDFYRKMSNCSIYFQSY